jgi:hypothetical protein
MTFSARKALRRVYGRAWRAVTAVKESRMKLPVAVMALLCGSCSLIPGTSAYNEKQAREILSDTLFDADTAKIRNVRADTDRLHKTGDKILCGEVNSKNRMGAYVGFHRFLVVPGERFAVVDPQADKNAGETEQTAQTVFDGAWPACDPSSAKPVETPQIVDKNGCNAALAKSAHLSCG